MTKWARADVRSFPTHRANQEARVLQVARKGEAQDLKGALEA